MNARSSRSAKAGQGSSDNQKPEPDLAFDDLLDARFDDEGRLSQIGRGSRQRITERLDPRPPSASAEDLERAVRKLAEGLDAIERQSRSQRPAESRRPAAGEGRDFVTYSLDRLEARLEALSQRLQSRADAAPVADADEELSQPKSSGQDEPALAAEPDYAAESAELRRMAEAEAERLQREAEAAAEERRRLAEAEAEEDARAEAEVRAEAEAADARRRAEAEAEEDARAEAEMRAGAKAAEARRRAEDEAAEARRLAEEEAAEARRRVEAEAAEARRRAEEAEAEALRQAEEAEKERLARLMEARREAELQAEMQRHFAEIEARVESLQRGLEENQVAPVREELMELLTEMTDLTRDRNDVVAALEQIGGRLGEMEAKVNAARNMAGNRLGDIQDRLADLTGRLDGVEVEIPGYDAIRENQGAILERFDRMEGLVHHIASQDELLERIDGLRRQLKTAASQEEAARLEERIIALADRIDALPEDLSDAESLERIEDQLATLASELTSTRQERMAAAANLDRRLSDLSEALQEVSESGRTPDLSSIEERLAEFGARLGADRDANGETLSRLERKLASLGEAIEAQENDAELLTSLARRIEALGEAIEGQDAPGTRRDIETLDGKLDQLAGQLAEQAEHLSRAQVQPLATRLDEMQEQLAELAERAKASSDQFRPFVQKLQEISDRLNALGADEHTPLSLRLEAIEERLSGINTGKGPDPRALQTQLEGIVSRLELLKGRSIDPARLNELFDRVDTAVRFLPEERLDRLERKLTDAAMATERFDKLERSIAQQAPSGVEEQLERLERRIAESAVTAEDIDRLERRIVESTGSGITYEDIDRLERRIVESAGGISQADIERLERAIAESTRQAPASSEISEERFAGLERKLQEIGVAATADGEFLNPEDLAELRTDIIALRRELRSLPALGEGEGGFGQVLNTIAERMERLPQDTPAATAALEAQVERIARLLDDPSHSRLALGHIESSLKTIEERLDETRRALAGRSAHGFAEADFGSDDTEAVADMARALSDDVADLKGTAAETKDGEALDAVQDTLQAVIKRMAFLERDAEKVPAEPAQAEAPEADAPVDEHAEPEDDEAAAVVERFETPAPVMLEADAADVADVIETEDAEAAEPEAAAEAGEPRSGGLLSRFTSRQLLRRATGGRAESFTPQADESEEEADLPLEPGTDSPLSSALTDAPSSDTELMSGSRNKARAELPLSVTDGERPVPSGGLTLESEVDGDFLAAARRAARAAAAEAASGEGPAASAGGRFAGVMKSRRGALMAAALAVAVAFAAFQIVRSQMSAGDSDVAAVPEMSAPAGDDGTPGMTAEAPAPTPAMEGGGTDVAATDAMTPAANAESSEMASMPEESAAPETPASEDVASLGATEKPEAAAGAEASQPELPVEIGSQRLRDAAMAGDLSALFEVAARYAEGRGVLMDMGTAVVWYTRAAEAGLAPAQYRLGSIYEKGLGVPRDLVKAQDWYRRAAEAGNVKAMHNLAVLYAEGAGGEPDLERAAALFRLAAERGVRDSQFNLAILYARGLGVPPDLIEAYKWFSIAATSGDEESAKRRDIISAALEESDLAKARAVAASFEPVPLVAEANEVPMPDGGWNDPQDATSVEMQPGSGEDQIGSVLSENDLVALVQKLLADKGFDPGPTDGLLGWQTMQAITDFQSQAGLPLTGQIDPDLVEALQGA